MSDNVNLHGVLESETKGKPVVFDGEEIATAEKLTDGRNGYKYTFNEKVDGLKDIRVRIIYPLFINPDKVPMGTKEYEIGDDGKYVLDEKGNPVLKADNKEKVSVTVAGKTASKDYTVEYESGVFEEKSTGPTLSGIADIDNVTDNNYNHTIYVNPTADQMLNGSHVTVQNEKGYNTITFDEEVKNSVKVYKVKDPNKLPLSFGNDFNDGNYEDVTSKANVKLVKDNNNADLMKLVVDVKQGNTNQSQPFDNKDFDNSSYVITYTGKRTPNKAFKTNTIYTADWRKAKGNVKNLSKLGDQSWEWTNEIVIDDADAIAIANKTYNLGDKVWIDADEDGSQGDSENGLEGVKVILKGINMSDKETTTDANGNYKFEGLKNGEYKVTFEIPEGYEATKSDQGDDDAKDSDGASVDVTINDANNDTIDFGLIKKETSTPEDKTYTLGDRVWVDENKDGIQDDSEKGLKDVTVKLTGGDLTEEKTTTTDENGNYKFEGLKNGEYKVTFKIPEGYEATKSDQGDDDAKDSDGASVDVTINDANNDTIDFGLIKKETSTPEDKTYTLGDKVWVDENKDGIQTEGEKGVEGVTVTLTGGDLKEAKTTKTDAKGNYKFEGLKNGNYTVTFELPEDYEVTKTDEGTDDEKDSDGKEVTATIKDADNMSVDLGLVKKETPTTPTPSEPKEPTVPSTPDEPILPSTPEEPEETTPLIPLTPADPAEQVESDEGKEVEKPEEEKSEETNVTEVVKQTEKVERDNVERVKVPNRSKTGNPKTGISSSLGLVSTLAASAFAYLVLDDKKRKNK